MCLHEWYSGDCSRLECGITGFEPRLQEVLFCFVFNRLLSFFFAVRLKCPQICTLSIKKGFEQIFKKTLTVSIVIEKLD